MEYFARIEDDSDIVAEIINFDPEGKMHPDIKFVKIPENIINIIRPELWKYTEKRGFQFSKSEYLVGYLMQAVSSSRWGLSQLPVKTHGYWFSASKDYMSTINDKITTGTIFEKNNPKKTYSVLFKTHPGEFVELTLKDLEEILVDLDAYINDLFKRENEIKEKLLSYVDDKDVDEVDTLEIHELRNTLNKTWPSNILDK